MKILVTGGAGYIGSFMVRRLLADGHEVGVIDSLERGVREAVDERAALYVGRIQDSEFVTNLLKDQKFEAVIHFAGYISMEESMRLPEIYFENNTFASLKFLDNLRKNEIKRIIFSSTAGVYGNPVRTPIDEDHPKNPENPYGESKLMFENILKWHNKIYGLDYAVLRYFNACGGDPEGLAGEAHNPETHIIPKAIEAVLSGQPFSLFGGDYKTPDGTCVRDYIHVLDLVEAHVLALNKLVRDPGGYIYNVGTGHGYSNKEIVEAVKKASGADFQVELRDRRPGDADELVADATRIKSDLGFAPRYSDLETIVGSAWKWHKNSAKLKDQSAKL